jgi:hypothetical protein
MFLWSGVWSQCRTCGHFRDKFAEYCINYIAFGNWHDVKECTCIEHIPLDNLLYMEYLYDKRIAR